MVYDDFTVSAVWWNVQEVWANQAVVLLLTLLKPTGKSARVSPMVTAARWSPAAQMHASFTATGGSPLLAFLSTGLTLAVWMLRWPPEPIGLASRR